MIFLDYLVLRRHQVARSQKNDYDQTLISPSYMDITKIKLKKVIKCNSSSGEAVITEISNIHYSTTLQIRLITCSELI
ncbi:unnamed protein product [Rotaria magnacalcarata]